MPLPRATRARTGVFILCFLIVGLAWETYATTTGGSEASISWTIYSYSVQVPFIPLAVGVLMGHLFIPQSRVRVVSDQQIQYPATGAVVS